MLSIHIKSQEFFDERRSEFIELKDQTICLEHSLVSVSKWEAKWHKPFLDDRFQKTKEEVIDYIRCMTITQNVDPYVYQTLSAENIGLIQQYIDNPMTATWFSDKKVKGGKKRVITSELIYSWMVSLNIPFECQKWHLNRLLTLIKVCNEENKPLDNKRKNMKELMSERAAINAMRRQKLGTRG